MQPDAKYQIRTRYSKSTWWKISPFSVYLCYLGALSLESAYMACSLTGFCHHDVLLVRQMEHQCGTVIIEWPLLLALLSTSP